MRMIAASDWVIDMGPGAGSACGEIVVAGTPAHVARSKTSVTARYLKRALPSVAAAR
jgi:excinuclease ABC subunit A